MICPKCKKEIPNGSAFCPQCGSGTADAIPYAEPVTPAIEKSGMPNWLLFALSLLWPVVGIIFWAVYRNSSPSKAKAALRGAVIGLIACAALIALMVVFYVILFIVYVIIFGGMYASIFSTIY